MVKGLGKEAEATDKSTEPLNLYFKIFVTYIDNESVPKINIYIAETYCGIKKYGQ